MRNYIIKLTNQVAIEGLREEEFDIEEIYVKKIFIRNRIHSENRPAIADTASYLSEMPDRAPPLRSRQIFSAKRKLHRDGDSYHTEQNHPQPHE